MTREELFMSRCFELARLGAGRVSPNPMVGALLLHRGQIIGEGFHRAFGRPHAEVNAVNSVPASKRHLLRESTLFVSLEPCCFQGKTPPCTDLILAKGIPKVVISCLDNTPEVSGKGVARLRENGVEVITGVLEAEGKALSRPRRVYVSAHRPYIILKFAQTRDGMFGMRGDQPFWISGPEARRLVHRWRSESDAILVGTRTARIDDPALTTRYYPGKNPLRVVLDRQGMLGASLQVFNGEAPCLRVVDRGVSLPAKEGVEVLPLAFDENLLDGLMRALHERKVGVLMVEGGSLLLQSFLQVGLWDEARVLIAGSALPDGLPAPSMPVAPVMRRRLGRDEMEIYRNPSST